MQLEDSHGTDNPGIGVVQVAIVVRDLDESIDAYRRLLGWTNWRVYDFRELEHVGTRIRQAEASYSMRTAIHRTGLVDFEIIEPIGPSPYTEFLEEKGPGLHHIQVRSKDSDALHDQLSASGLPFLMGGTIRIGPDAELDYVYHDATDALHLFLESTYGDRERLLGLITHRSPDDAAPAHTGEQDRGTAAER